MGAGKWGAGLSGNRFSSPTETASDAGGRGLGLPSPLRARRQAGIFEFHWGKPPPAAEPSTTIRTAALLGVRGSGDSCYFFTLAQAYELISVPTAISVIVGFFQDIASSDIMVAITLTIMSEAGNACEHEDTDAVSSAADSLPAARAAEAACRTSGAVGRLEGLAADPRGLPGGA